MNLKINVLTTLIKIYLNLILFLKMKKNKKNKKRGKRRRKKKNIIKTSEIIKKIISNKD